MNKARYVMIGGFLGAGKSTAALRIARSLRDQGLRVGLITNDQSHGLVDTRLVGARGLPVEEITGGCFCCRFQSLTEAAERLSAATRPDVFLAEPVGSCTDLKATVDYPLRRIYGAAYSIAPLSVMVDPMRALRILGLEPGKSFSEKVRYIYRKQLEEADLIAVNKIDVHGPERTEKLREALAASFPGARVLAVSAREGTGMKEWMEALAAGEGRTEGAMDVDYDEYAEGEALLGWLNATAAVSSGEPFDGNRALLNLAVEIRRRLVERGAEVAHLKLTLTPDEGADIGVANLVGSEAEPEVAHRLAEPLESGELIINLRAEADPELLRAAALDGLDTLRDGYGVAIAVEHAECFRPARPTPTHRLTGVES